MEPVTEINNKKEFTGLWIPITILVLQELTLNDKAVFSTILYLSRNKPAFPSNEFIANILKISKRTVERSLSKLLNLKLITNEGFDGRKRYLEVNDNVFNQKYYESIGVTGQKNLPNKIQFSDAASTKSGAQYRQNGDHILDNNKKENNNDVFEKLKYEINLFFKTDKLNNTYLDGQLFMFLKWLSQKKEIKNFQIKFSAYKK